MPSQTMGAAPISGADRAAFVKSMRAVPGAVAIITSASGDEKTGMAATAWNSLCADPPTLLVCVNQTASAHALIHRAGAFSVNLVPSDAAETVAIFSAQRGLNGADRFVEGHWSSGPGGQPMLDSAIVSFECELTADHTYGTHTVFIGKVGEIRSTDRGEALIYLDGAYSRAIGLL